jgi:hypothetical protein
MEFVPVPTVRDALTDCKGVLRLEELLEETAMSELQARRELDALALAGEVKRAPVGNHVMIRCTDEFTPDDFSDLPPPARAGESGATSTPPGT